MKKILFTQKIKQIKSFALKYKLNLSAREVYIIVQINETIYVIEYMQWISRLAIDIYEKTKLHWINNTYYKADRVHLKCNTMPNSQQILKYIANL